MLLFSEFGDIFQVKKMDKGAAVPPHVALISGSLAGVGVDITLFPLDTLKTRLQSQQGTVL